MPVRQVSGCHPGREESRGPLARGAAWVEGSTAERLDAVPSVNLGGGPAHRGRLLGLERPLRRTLKAVAILLVGLRSPLASPEGRLSLLQELRRRGFYVRMHAYEYLVGDEREFLCIILLEPQTGGATVLQLRRRAANRITEAIKSVDPGIRIIIEDRERGAIGGRRGRPAGAFPASR